mmetsp:Transcript_15100/g.25615  ORF Transcript_15100/g.25615 Transcript_15100/m.25615 type:complete len:247 (+) Transcript_15100:69-809(+)
MIFVMQGSYFVGYEINKMRKMKLHFPPGTQIGGFNCIFNRKSMFIYKTHYKIEGYSIRRAPLYELSEQFPKMMNELKKRIVLFYNREVRTPLQHQKNRDIENLMNRADFQTLLAIKDEGEDEVQEVIREIWSDEEDVSIDTVVMMDHRVHNLEHLIYNMIKRAQEAPEYDPDYQLQQVEEFLQSSPSKSRKLSKSPGQPQRNHHSVSRNVASPYQPETLNVKFKSPLKKNIKAMVSMGIIKKRNSN